MLRATEIALKFAHVRPNGTMCSTAFSSSVPGAMGENIYMSYYSPSTAQQAFTTWQETDANYDGQGHRRNMLSSNFKTVGIGHFRVGIYDCWVQDFGGGVADGTATAANDQSTEVNLEVDKSRVADLTVTPDHSSLTMQVGESQSLPSVTVSAKLFNKSFTLWT